MERQDGTRHGKENMFVYVPTLSLRRQLQYKQNELKAYRSAISKQSAGKQDETQWLSLVIS
jgi:hypothetical protein